MSAPLTESRRGRVYQNESGFVLIVVLWAVAMVTIIALGFGRRAVLDTTAAMYSVDHAQAMMLARGAAERGIVEVRNKVMLDMLEKEPPAGTHLGQPWARPGDLYADDLYYSSEDKNPADIAQYTIEDAERYINVNTAPEALLRNIKAVSPSTLKKIIYRRTKETHKGEGISAFQAVEELRYLDGVDDEAWFGTKRHPGLVELVTTVGTGKVNPSTASEEVLRCIPGLPPATAGRIAAYCRGEDGKPGTEDDRGFKSFEDFTKKLNLQGDGAQAIQQYCAFDSKFFIITGTATRQGGKVRASCTVTVEVDGGNARVIAWKEDVLGA